ncbi:MAG: ribonuclease III [Microcoleaceae cyanobacterium]
MSIGYPRRQQQLQQLIERLGIIDTTSIQWHLLDLALTHPTIDSKANYEQLEFIGDAVVRLTASELLYEIYPELPVGDFAAVRSVLVSDRVLAEIANSYGFDRYLLITDSLRRDSIALESTVADSFEALLAALYLGTHTLALIRPWLDPLFRQRAAEIISDPARQNYKAALQEWTQNYYKALPKYQVEEVGLANHDERFYAQVWFQGHKLGEGKGRSIKRAEQAAAKQAYLLLESKPEFLKS